MAYSTHPSFEKYGEDIPRDEPGAFELSDEQKAKASQFKIADAHCHIYPSKISVKASKAVGSFYDLMMYNKSGDADTLIEQGSKIGARKYVVCSVATKMEQVESIDTYLASECKLHPEFVGLGAYYPGYEDVEKLLDQTAQLGLSGIKIHPDFQKVNIDDPMMFPLYRELEKRKMPLLMHMGDDRYDFSAPRRLANVLEKFPGLVVDAAHLGGWLAWDEAYKLLKDTPAYFDLSSSLAFMSVERAREIFYGYGTDRIMFGVDFPMWNHQAELARTFALGLTDDELRDVLYNNFARFYGVED